MVTIPVSRHAIASGFFPARSAALERAPQTNSNRPTVPDDSVAISAAGRQQAAEAPGDAPVDQAETPSGDTGLPTPGTSPELDPAARRVLEALRRRDQEVRRHEQAHLLAAGPYARGGPSYTYEIGPDGRLYAVGGEVPIDLSAVPGDPQATLQKARTLRRAALAPTHPSGADLAIAVQATALAAQAQQELSQAQSNGRLTAQRAAQAETASSIAAPAATPSTSAARHVCGPNCQNHGARVAPAANVPAALNPIAIATRALRSYQLAATAVST